MGRKRRLPARAREKLVGEEVATAMEVDQKEGVLQARPDDALFVVDTVGERERARDGSGAGRLWLVDLSCPPHLRVSVW